MTKLAFSANAPSERWISWRRQDHPDGRSVPVTKAPGQLDDVAAPCDPKLA